MNHCLWCDEPYDESLTWNQLFGKTTIDLLCGECRHSLSVISGEICRMCGRMVEMTEKIYMSGDLCHDCERWEMNPNGWSRFQKNRSLYVYDETMKELITRFKFRGDAILMKAIQFNWKQLWEKEFKDHEAVPLPLSDERQYERGFNQSVILAELLDVPIKDCLSRRFHEGKQSGKTREQRLQLSDSLFYIQDDVSLHKVDAVIIDDIYTTGTTVRNAANILLQNGARSVSSMTLAR